MSTLVVTPAGRMSEEPSEKSVAEPTAVAEVPALRSFVDPTCTPLTITLPLFKPPTPLMTPETDELAITKRSWTFTFSPEASMLKDAHFTLEAPTATLAVGESGASETETPEDAVTAAIVWRPDDAAEKAVPAAVVLSVTG